MKRSFSVASDGTVTLDCNACGLEKERSQFYVKYKDRPQTDVSHWQEKCRACAKIYRTAHYKKNADAINKARLDHYHSNHEKYLEESRARDLRSSLDPERLLQRRAVQKMDTKARYIRRRCQGWKKQAGYKGLVWELDESFIVETLSSQKGLCTYTGRELVLAPNHIDTLSVDRINSDLGYTRDNVVLCGNIANRMKQDLSVEDFRSFIEDLYRNRDNWLGRRKDGEPR